MWSILNLIMRISMGSRKICWPTIIRLEFSVVNIPQVEYWSSPCWWQVFYFTLWIEWRWHVSHWRSWCGILASKVPNWQGMSKVVVFSRVKGSHTLLKCELRRDHDVLWRHSVLSSVETLDLFFSFFFGLFVWVLLLFCEFFSIQVQMVSSPLASHSKDMKFLALINAWYKEMSLSKW